jgi:hypothetical protein
MTENDNQNFSVVDPRKIQLRFDGDSADKHYISAAQLAGSIDALRRSVELTALEALGIELRSRDRLPAELQRQYGLYVAAPKSGSFIVEGFIGSIDGQVEGFDEVEKLAIRFQESWQALLAGNWPTLERYFPDRVRLRRWVDTAVRIGPKASGRSTVCLGIGDLLLGLENLPARAMEFREQRTSFSTKSMINGYLAEIDFLGRSFKLRYPEGNRLLSGSYNEEVEEFLLANPRELIQVTGLVLYDGNGPTEISDAIAFDVVDRSAVEISEFESSGKWIRATRPITLSVELDETEQYLTASFEPLKLEQAARTRQELERSIYEELDVLWRNIAMTADDGLALEAKNTKQWLLTHFREADDATG